MILNVHMQMCVQYMTTSALTYKLWCLYIVIWHLSRSMLVYVLKLALLKILLPRLFLLISQASHWPSVCRVGDGSRCTVHVTISTLALATKTKTQAQTNTWPYRALAMNTAQSLGVFFFLPAALNPGFPSAQPTFLVCHRHCRQIQLGWKGPGETWPVGIDSPWILRQNPSSHFPLLWTAWHRTKPWTIISGCLRNQRCVQNYHSQMPWQALPCKWYRSTTSPCFWYKLPNCLKITYQAISTIPMISCYIWCCFNVRPNMSTNCIVCEML